MKNVPKMTLKANYNTEYFYMDFFILKCTQKYIKLSLYYVRLYNYEVYWSQREIIPFVVWKNCICFPHL